MEDKIRRVTRNAYNRVSRQRGATRYPTRLRDQGPLLLGADANQIRLRDRRQMKLGSVLDIKRIRNERKHSIRPPELRPPPLTRWVITGRKAPCGPPCGGHSPLCELAHEWLCAPRRTGIPGSAEHQSR